MHADTAARTVGTLILSVLMTAALMIAVHVALPAGTARVPSPRVSDSYDVLRVPLNLAEVLSGEPGTDSTPPRGESPAGSMTMRPAPTANSQSASLAMRDEPEVRRARPRSRASSAAPAPRRKPARSSTGDDGRGTPAARDEDSSRSGKPPEPAKPTRPDTGGGSGPQTQGQGRGSTPGRGLTKDRTDSRPLRTAAAGTSESQRVDRPAPPSPNVKPSAGKPPRKSVGAKPASRAATRRGARPNNGRA